MNILIAPNAFKNSLSAEITAAAIAKGFEESDLACICQLFPVGDGGDGTGRLITNHFKGHFINVDVHDPLDRQLNAEFGLSANGKTAVIEMASASGMRLLKPDELNPLAANSAGTGELVKAALDQGVNKIIITLGGSATVDGGMGILTALGCRFLGVDDELITSPADLTNLFNIDQSKLDTRLQGVEIIVLCDVKNLLTGPEGAAAVFGPQKGATPENVEILEAGLNQFAAVWQRQTGIDLTVITHGGAAGGTAAGLYALLNAKLVDGADYFLKLTGFNNALAQADLVITGEGSLDEQTLQGKAPYTVAVAAKQAGLRVIGLAGNIPSIAVKKLNRFFDVLLNINSNMSDLSTALANTEQNLISAALQLGNQLAATDK